MSQITNKRLGDTAVAASALLIPNRFQKSDWSSLQAQEGGVLDGQNICVDVERGEDRLLVSRGLLNPHN